MPRLLAHLVVFLLALAFPWWVAVVAVFLASILFKNFFDGIVWIAFLSLLYDVNGPGIWFIIWLTAYIIFVYAFESFVRPKLKV